MMLKQIFKKRDSAKETFIEVFCNLLSCWLISVGTCIIFDSYFETKTGIQTILWQTAVSAVAALLFTRKKRIFSVVIGILVAAVLVLATFSGNLKPLIQTVYNFFKWWFSACPDYSPFYSEQTFYILHAIINFGVTALYCLISRVTKRAWITVAVAFGIIVFSLIEGYTSYDFWAIPFLIVAIFPLAASDKFQSVNLSKFKDLFGALDKKWLYTIVSTIVVVVICIVSVSAVSLLGDDVRTRFCTDIVSDVQTATDIYTKEQEERNVSLFDLGLVTDSTYIGGDIEELAPGTLATTNLTEPTLVKITAFDDFDGVIWTNSFEKSYRLNGPWQKAEETYLSTRLIDDKIFGILMQNIFQKKSVTITLNRASHVIPTIGQVHNFKEITKNKNQVLFDECGRFLSYYGQDEGFKYSFDTLMYDTKSTKIKAELRNVIAFYGNARDPLYNKESEFFKTYTKQFENTPEVIDLIIKNMGFAIDNYYDKAYRICEFFSEENGFVYTNTPPSFKKGENVIEKLFDSKQGHCLYYSTAMIAMTRKVGIPSRMAVGYKTVMDKKTKCQIIDRSMPYAWVECYIPHIGWMYFDPTPTGESVLENNKNSVYSDEEEQSAEIEIETNIPMPGTVLEWDDGVNIPLIVAGGVLALLLLIAIIHTAFSRLFYRLKAVRKRFPDTKLQAEFYYHDILRQLFWLGFRFKKGETISELSARACNTITESYANMLSKKILAVEDLCYEGAEDNDKLAVERTREELVKAFTDGNAFDRVKKGIEVIEAVRYGDITPTPDEIQTIFEAHENLEKVLKDRKTIFGYIIKRRLVLPTVWFW